MTFPSSDVSLQIFSYLSIDCCAKILPLVSKRWKELANHDTLWKEFCQRKHLEGQEDHLKEYYFHPEWDILRQISSLSAPKRIFSSKTFEPNLKIFLILNHSELLTLNQKTVKKWNLQNNKSDVIRKSCVTMTSIGSSKVLIYSETNTIEEWDFDENVSFNHFSPKEQISYLKMLDEKFILGRSLNTIFVWNRFTSNLEYEIPTNAFSKEGHIAHSCNGSLFMTLFPNKIVIYDLEKKEQSLIEDQSSKQYLSLSLAAHKVAVGTAGKTIEIWNLQTKKHNVTLPTARSLVTSLFIKGDLLLSSSSESALEWCTTLQVWDMRMAKCIKTAELENIVSSIAFYDTMIALASPWEEISILKFKTEE